MGAAPAPDGYVEVAWFCISGVRGFISGLD
jgi:hypothetical protein